ncbi:RCC1-like domain-containing protein [Melittangium boletus]|uniref:RCC1-like domain-containing protein n=1 Tax=Melittangium boletus TaxID=83453 RepID=UPI003DA4BB4B
MRRVLSSWCVLFLSLLGSLAWAQPLEEFEATHLAPGPLSRRGPTLAAAETHSLALGPGGSVWAWGTNYYSELGVPSSLVYQSRPLRVGQLTGMVAVAAGGSHSLALGADGRVWGWGFNGSGSLGLGWNVWEQETPTLMPGITDVVALAASTWHTLLLRRDGTVWAVGQNNNGQLGLEDSFNVTVTQVPGLTGIVSIATGETHSLAVHRDGSLWSWGSNDAGQLGRGWSSAPILAPARVPGLTQVVTAAVGTWHSLALKRDGTLWAWGESTGTGHAQTEPNYATPHRVAAISGVVSIGANDQASLALRRDGTLWGWGYSHGEKLGDVPSPLPKTPAQVSLTIRPVEVSMGKGHTLARTKEGTLWAWGDNSNWAAGTGSEQRVAPVPLPHGQGEVTAVFDWASALALHADGSVWAWGAGAFLPGEPPSADHRPPTRVPGFADAVCVTTVRGSSLVVRADGSVWAWGSNYEGLLGDGTTTPRLAPAPIPGLSGIVAVASASPYGRAGHVLALGGDGRVWSWGHNHAGQLGDGTTTPRLTPAPIPGLSGIVAVATGAAQSTQSFALDGNGRVWAWGGNAQGQLGDGTNTGRLTPVLVPGLTQVVALATSASHVLALRADGTVWSWGESFAGVLGVDTPSSRNSPAPVPGLTDVVAVATGDLHALALRADGTVWSWGNNFRGELGRPGVVSSSTPAAVPGLTGVVSISAGRAVSHASLAHGETRAWGGNNESLLGDGWLIQDREARRVLMPQP